MQPVDIIRRKRDGQALDAAAIDAFVRGATDASWSDAQLAALLMAVLLRGMTAEETRLLTAAMTHSGTVLRVANPPGPVLDKHSTGGVGDKVSLVLAPVVAACGGCVPMMSGRGLGHTGGTIDKLEAVPGLRTTLAPAEIDRVLRAAGCCIASASGQLAPADGRLYALRDMTATIDSVPLITSSILSKKLAEGLDGLVLDVKTGRGAFMQTEAEARELAEALVDIGRRQGLAVEALLTAMDVPLGRAVGNGLELREAIDVLAGGGPADVRELTTVLAARLLCLGRLAADESGARQLVQRALDSGTALERFRAMIAAQGGDPHVTDDPARLPRAPRVARVVASVDGFVCDIDARAIGGAAVQLGAGRTRQTDDVDPAAGVTLLAQVGDRVTAGEPIAELHGRSEASLQRARDVVAAAFRFARHPPPAAALVRGCITPTSSAS
jgi:pyrimidine-nucleoside phosphorylase